MIELPSDEEISVLQDMRSEACVTIIMKLEIENRNANIYKFEKIINSLKLELDSIETSFKTRDRICENVKKVFQKQIWLSEDKKYLVIFVNDSIMKWFHLPSLDISDMIVIDYKFYVQPIVNLINRQNDFILLTLSHKQIRLFNVNKYMLKPIKIKNLPTNIKQSLHIDEYPNSRQMHSVAPVSTGKGSKAFHQQYNVAETDKLMLVQFFQKVDKSLHKYLNKQQKPLIIGGVGYLLPIYRQINTYGKLLNQNITGNLDRLKDEEILKKFNHMLDENSTLISAK